MNAATPASWFRRLCLIAFSVACVFAVSTSAWLVTHLPDDAPLGGPDEPMHRSLSSSIARHLAWPSWDSGELERYSNGGSYATGSSLGYWIEALLLRITGMKRLSAAALFLVCLGVVAYFARKNPLAGLLGAAALVPQVLFVFSYVNSDAWSVTVCLLLGVAVAFFRRDSTRTENLLLLFAFAAACVTCRQHVWVIGGLGFAYVFLPRLSPVLVENPRGFAAAMALAAVIAAWWPVTSYRANDGDPLGFKASAKARAQFADPQRPSLSRPWEQIDLVEYYSLIGRSLYGAWGWGTVFLTTAEYAAALALALPVAVWICWRFPRWIPLFVLMPVVSVGLLLYYSITYDYQWQGRYLFPSLSLLLGIVLAELSFDESNTPAGAGRWAVFAALSGLVVLNIACTVSLVTQVHNERTAYVSHGLHLLQMRKFDRAIAKFQQALLENPGDAAAHNGMGLVKMEQHDPEAARRHFQSAIETAPNDPAAYMNLGVSYLTARELEKAVEQFHAAERVASDSALIQYHLSDAYAQLGNFDAAIAHCRRALDIEPGYEPGQRLLQNLEARSRNVSPK